MSTGSDKCPRCDKSVFHGEEVKAVGKRYHEECFKCFSCKISLTPIDVQDRDGEIYCRKCYGQNFGPTGFRGGAAASGGYVADVTTTSGELKSTAGSNIGPSYGLDADIKAKQSAKFDKSLEAKARAFIEGTTGESIGDNFADGLRDGILLCKLLNKLKSGSVTGFKPSSMTFVKMENISKFLKALNDEFGLKSTDTFMTVDLYEEKNLVAVIDTILMLQRKVSSS